MGPSRDSAGSRLNADEVFVCDELVAVLLEDDAGEGPPPDYQNRFVVLLEFFDKGYEVAVTAHNDESVDVVSRESHLQGIQRQGNIRPVFVSSRRQVSLDHLDCVLRHGPAKVFRPLPVPVRDLRNHLSPFLDGFQHGSNVEIAAQGLPDSDGYVVKVDKYGNLQTFFAQDTHLVSSPSQQDRNARQIRAYADYITTFAVGIRPNLESAHVSPVRACAWQVMPQGNAA